VLRFPFIKLNDIRDETERREPFITKTIDLTERDFLIRMLYKVIGLDCAVFNVPSNTV